MILIENIDLKHTSEMEKAMQQAHGFGYSEYSQQLEKRLKVERAREKNYRQSLQLLTEIKYRF